MRALCEDVDVEDVYGAWFAAEFNHRAKRPVRAQRACLPLTRTDERARRYKPRSR